MNRRQRIESLTYGPAGIDFNPRMGLMSNGINRIKLWIIVTEILAPVRSRSLGEKAAD